MFYSIASIAKVTQALHVSSQKIVLATGFFDLLHQEHINFLRKAKAAGDILIVGVESDARALATKGAGRPIEPQLVRCQKISKYVDYVLALDDDFDNQEAYENLIAKIKPDIYAVSSHTSFLANKQALVEKYGGQLMIVHQWNPQVSTSRLLAAKKKQL